jgi:hypothetical protein
LDFFLDPTTSNVVYLGLTINGSEYLFDYSGLPNSFAIIFPSGGTLMIDNNGIHIATGNCSYEVDILVPNFFEQADAEASSLTKRHSRLDKRFQTSFQVDLLLSDQCGDPVTSMIFPSNALALGKSSCSLLPSAQQTELFIGLWAWSCQYPGPNSAEGVCETNVANFLNNYRGKVSPVAAPLTATGWFFKFFPPTANVFSILKTGVTGANIVVGPLGKIGTAILVLGANNMATSLCQVKGDPPYQLVFTTQPTPINLAALEAAPIAVQEYSIQIDDPSKGDCTCQVAKRDQIGWNQPCNLLQNPSFDSSEIAADPSDPWGLWSGYQAFWVGGGGPDGNAGCASGQAGDNCM